MFAQQLTEPSDQPATDRGRSRSPVTERRYGCRHGEVDVGGGTSRAERAAGDRGAGGQLTRTRLDANRLEDLVRSLDDDGVIGEQLVHDDS